MGKTYLETIKYLIVAEFHVDGLVEKPDVIGAIFGQSEGLLGSQLDIKELQQNGKLGRIEISISYTNNKTSGTLKLPCSLSMVETAIIAASIESIDKVGPCDTTFTVKKIEDTRGLKRKQIKDRAIDLLGRLMQEEIPDTRELMDEIVDTFKIKDIVHYGPDKLPAGPAIDSNKELIVVEGRADVINMLKYGFTNVISTGGARVPPSLVEIAKNKIVILFLDGDRGADIQQSQLLRSIKVDFIARAPDGKEVEELTQKEINQALRRRIKSAFLVDNFGKENSRKSIPPNIVKQTKFSTTNVSKPSNVAFQEKPFQEKPFQEKPFQERSFTPSFQRATNNFDSMLSDIPNVERIDLSKNTFQKPYNDFSKNKQFNARPKSFSENKKYTERASSQKPSFQKVTEVKQEKPNNIANQVKLSLKDRLENALKEFDLKNKSVKEQEVVQKKQENIQEQKAQETKPQEKTKKKIALPKLTEKIKNSFLKILDEIDGSEQSRILNEKLRRIGSSKNDELLLKIKAFKTGKIYAVITDLEITSDFLRALKEKEIPFIVAPKSKIKDDTEINIITYNELKR